MRHALLLCSFRGVCLDMTPVDVIVRGPTIAPGVLLSYIALLYRVYYIGPYCIGRYYIDPYYL